MVQKFMVENYRVEKAGVERSGVEALGWKVRGWEILQLFESGHIFEPKNELWRNENSHGNPGYAEVSFEHELKNLVFLKTKKIKKVCP